MQSSIWDYELKVGYLLDEITGEKSQLKLFQFVLHHRKIFK